ncbi:GntR family transcriptional regulator [Streptomyces xanthochromogenes]|uniref:GntR family transcriptional regulator n=1 Tax=Streptomyces xanthochromogenes TaxID=67384 RepID=UPI001674AC86|nr:GntR family transcriptional regulator [Streptomyces xanthochromogenes]GHB75829.1 GntR family transcriptional regulator [Streptomyces xanthochromogenes]
MPPKWKALADALAAQIKSGKYAPGDRLPKIEDTAKDAGLAKNTVHQAYKALEVAGLVTSSRGHGTVVRNRLPLASGAEREARSKLTGSSWRAGERSDSHMAGIVAAPEEVADALEIAVGERVLRRSRTYRDEHTNQVISHSTSWIPVGFADELPELLMGKRLASGTSIDVITRHTGRPVVRRVSSMWARNTTPADAGPLEIPEDTRAAVIVLTVRVIDSAGVVIEYGVDVGGPGRRWTREESTS